MPGSVYAWGHNDGGQLGINNTTSSTTPLQVKGVSNSGFLGKIKAVSAGRHSLALRSNGLVLAWGHNEQGQLGDGSTTNKTTPVIVMADQNNNLTNIKAISAGKLSWAYTSHSLALGGDGKVFAWGDNGSGQLGDNTKVLKKFPIKVLGVNKVDPLNNIREVSAGPATSLALGANGKVYAWGNNDFGQLGDGTTTSRTTPIEVPGLSNIVAISSSTHSLALRWDGVVFAWGHNSSGQLGSNNASKTPIQVGGLSNIVAISAGLQHNLALRSDGVVFAWGNNENGQLGNDSKTSSTTPIQVMSDVVAISAGLSESCALRWDNQLFTWGDNSHGQLGNGTNTASLMPVQVPNFSGVLAMSMGSLSVLALR